MNWENTKKQILSAVDDWTMPVIYTIAILVVGWILASIIGGITRSMVKRSTKNEMLAGFVGSIVQNLVRVIVIVSAIGQLGVDTTSFAAVIAAMGLAIGLAFQDSLGNLASGVMLIVFQPFEKGEFVEAGGVTGVVQEVSMFATVLLTIDNKRVVIGNGDITDGPITNFSREELRMVDLVFGIGYEDDIDKARENLEACIKGIDKILDDPSHTIAVGELADSSVNFVTRVWCKSEDYWDVRWTLLEAVKKRFDEQGISIPYPQTDVHLHQVA